MNIEEAVGKLFTVVGIGRYKRTLEHDSLVIDTYKNTYFWNSKGYGGTVEDFLIRELHLHPKDAAILSSDPINFKKETKEIVNKNSYKIFWEHGKSNRKLWYSRGFNDEVIDMYFLGYMGGFYTIPCILDNVLNAIILRNEHKIISEIEGSKPSLFGYDQVDSDFIIIVESVMDVPLLRMLGINAVSHNYGSNVWDKTWSSKFIGKEVIYIPDNDSAGYSAVKKLDFSCKVAFWPKGTPYHFDVGKLFLNNTFKFESNVKYLLDHAVPIEFIKETKYV